MKQKVAYITLEANLKAFHMYLTQAFFQHFCENSSAKKTQNLPFGQKLKPIFVQKLKLGAAFLNIRKKLDARAGFQYPSKKLIDYDTL